MTTRHVCLLFVASISITSAQEPSWGEALAARRRDHEAAGGTPASEAAVDAALRWLARHQAEDGSWRPEHWKQRCEARAPCAGGTWEHGDSRFTHGVTALALLPFLGRGITPEDATHGRVVARARAWLMEQPNAGRGYDALGFSEGHGESVYNVALMTLALAELAALTGDPHVRAQARRAAEWCVAAHNPGIGWKYSIRSGRNDTSVTTWMVHALRQAERAGVADPEPVTYLGALNWFTRATDSEGNVGYETPGGGSSLLMWADGKFDFPELPTLTAAGLFGRRLLGDDPRRAGHAKLVAIVDARPPAWEPRRLHFCYWFWGTHALRQVGGEPWLRWGSALKKALLPNQRKDGCAAGSWNPDDPWSPAGGRVYATALLALALEAHYHLPQLPRRDLSAEFDAREAEKSAREAAAGAEQQLSDDLAALRAALDGATDPRALPQARYKALPAVLRAMKDPRPRLREAADAAVARLDDARVRTVLEDLRDGPRHVRRDALKLAALLSAKGQPVLDALVAALADKESTVRVGAAEALARWGPAARSAIPALERATQDAEWAVKNAAQRALERVRAP